MYNGMAETRKTGRGDYLSKGELSRASGGDGGGIRFTKMSQLFNEASPRSAPGCVGRSLSLLLKSSFNHDCTQHTTSGSRGAPASVCLPSLLLVSCNERASLQTEARRVYGLLPRSNIHPAAPTSTEEKAPGIVPMQLPRPVCCPK